MGEGVKLVLDNFLGNIIPKELPNELASVGKEVRISPRNSSHLL